MAYVMNSIAGLAHTNYLQLFTTQKAPGVSSSDAYSAMSDVGAVVDNPRAGWWLAEV